MDIVRSKKKLPKISLKFFLEQRKYFLLEHRKALKEQKAKVEFPKSSDPFTLSFF